MVIIDKYEVKKAKDHKEDGEYILFHQKETERGYNYQRVFKGSYKECMKEKKKKENSEKEKKHLKDLLDNSLKMYDEGQKEIERLNDYLKFYEDLSGTQNEEIERLNSIINESNKMIDKIVEEVYKPVDKEWDNILCIIEDYKLKLQEPKGSVSNE